MSFYGQSIRQKRVWRTRESARNELDKLRSDYPQGTGTAEIHAFIDLDCIEQNIYETLEQDQLLCITQGPHALIDIVYLVSLATSEVLQNPIYCDWQFLSDALFSFNEDDDIDPQLVSYLSGSPRLRDYFNYYSKDGLDVGNPRSIAHEVLANYCFELVLSKSNLIQRKVIENINNFKFNNYPLYVQIKNNITLNFAGHWYFVTKYCGQYAFSFIMDDTDLINHGTTASWVSPAHFLI